MLQDSGWYAPNARTIEAFHGVLGRGIDLMGPLPELGWQLAWPLWGTTLALPASRSRPRF